MTWEWGRPPISEELAHNHAPINQKEFLEIREKIRKAMCLIEDAQRNICSAEVKMQEVMFTIDAPAGRVSTEVKRELEDDK
jgi:hypothetical protein